MLRSIVWAFFPEKMSIFPLTIGNDILGKNVTKIGAFWAKKCGEFKGTSSFLVQAKFLLFWQI